MSKPETMMIDDVKYVREDSIEVREDGSTKEHPYELGEIYAVRTVTMIQLGRLKAIYDQELVLSDAAWIADAGRYNEFLLGKTVNEVEPFHGDVIVNRGSIIDVAKRPELLLEVK